MGIDKDSEFEDIGSSSYIEVQIQIFVIELKKGTRRRRINGVSSV